MDVLTVIFGLVMLVSVAAGSGYNIIAAAAAGNVAYVKQAIDDGIININSRNEDGFKTVLGHTPLIEASLNNHIEVVKLLLDAGAIVDLPDDYGTTALMHASLNNRIEIVKLLLEAGATVNQADNYSGRTALIGASSKNHIEVIKLLLEAGSIVNQASNGGITALMDASSYANVKVVKLLLEAGASVDQVDVDGWTALHWAATGDSINVVNELLKNGANASKLDNGSNTPADIARDYENSIVADYFLDYTHQATSTTVSANQLSLLVKVISREVFLTGILMALTTA